MSDSNTSQPHDLHRSLSVDETPSNDDMSHYSDDEEYQENEQEQGYPVEERQKIINTVCPGSIRNEQEYCAAKSRRLDDLRQKKEPVGDDFPSTDAAKREFVKDLFGVIKNTTSNEIIDRRVRTGKLARGIRMMESGVFEDEFIEQKCWELMLAAGDSSRGIQLNDPSHSKENKYESYPTFLARWVEIKHTLLVSKAACENMLKMQEFLHRLADAPRGCLKAKINNLVINNKRDMENYAGRKAFAEGHINPADLIDRRPAVGEPTIGSPRRTNHTLRKKNSNTTPKTPARSKSNSAIVTSNCKRMSATRPSSQGDNDYSGGAVCTPSKKKTATGNKPRSNSTLRTTSTADDTDDQGDGNNLSTRYRVIRPQPLSRISAPAALASSERISASRQGFLLNNPEAMRQGQGLFANNIQSTDVLEDIAMDPSFGGIATQQVMNDAIEAARLEDYYKRIICHLLGVDSSFARMYRLDQLRTYANGYNESFQNIQWRVSLFGLSAVGPILCIQDGSFTHMVEYDNEFQHLAHARGDLLQERLTGQEQPRYVRPSSELEEKALGIRHNPFGLL